MNCQKTAMLAAAFSLGLATSAAIAAESVYMSIEEDNCVLFSVNPAGASAVCRGPAGVNLVIHDADARVLLEFVHPDWSETALLNLTAIHQSFTWLPARVVEWRVDGGAPRALIARLGIDDGVSGGTRSTEELLVFRVDLGDPFNTCLTARVPNDAGANEAARRAADAAAGAPCLLDPS